MKGGWFSQEEWGPECPEPEQRGIVCQGPNHIGHRTGRRDLGVRALQDGLGPRLQVSASGWPPPSRRLDQRLSVVHVVDHVLAVGVLVDQLH